MPWRVQRAPGDVHRIGLGTWSLPEPMALGRAHEAWHTQNAHHTHTLPTTAPTYAHRHMCSPYSLAFISNLPGSGPHGYGQSWTGCSSRPGGGLC